MVVAPGAVVVVTPGAVVVVAEAVVVVAGTAPTSVGKDTVAVAVSVPNV